MYDFKAVEEEILAFWKKKGIFNKSRNRCKTGKNYYFLDGPPYTSGNVHIGTAWNKSMKDMVLRYKRMRGFNVWDRAGYDMHGLPIEHATEKKLGLSGKRDIDNFGVDKFVAECKKLCVDNMKKMNDDFVRMGVWMDFENAYQSIKDEFIDGEWWLVKKAHENGRLYLGERSMSWCGSCATACAKHELEYKEVKDNSIFVKLAVKGKKNEFLVIWTTTPWTIPFNLACMVHPKFDYVKAAVNDEVWIVAKEMVEDVVVNKAGEKFKILEEFKGKKLEGLQYNGVFEDEVPQIAQWKKECPKTYSVLLSEEYVNLDAGSGIVHCAPGCGPEDYEVGHKNKIKPLNTLDEHGVFSQIPAFDGLVARKDDKEFIEKIDEKGMLVVATKYDHDYAHCWRCKNAIVYKTTKQWFFKVEDIKKKMIKENNSVKWVPEAAYNAFNSWLENLRDNSITKQRYWGCPLPVWQNSEDPEDYIVVGSKLELEKLAGFKITDMHKPKIDDVVIKKDGKEYRRVPDILDVWVDAGTVSWNCLSYPARKDFFENYFPAEFILEGKDQIRGWFNLLLVASMISMGKKSFKNVYMHGFVQDSQGRKMSKSLGNYILPSEVIDKYGADTLRYYTIGGAAPAVDLNYNFEDMKLKHKNLMVLWNLQNFLVSLSLELGVSPQELSISDSKLGIEEKYIFSKLHSGIKKVTEKMDGYLINEVPSLIEEIYLELSRTYIQMVRDKASSDSEGKKIVVYTLYNVFIDMLKMLSIVCPFISEKIFLNFKEEFSLKEESVHLLDWPSFNKKNIHEKYETNMSIVSNILQVSASAREKVQLGLRWPLREMIIVSSNGDVENAVHQMENILLGQANVKSVKVMSKFDKVEECVKPNFKEIGADFGKDVGGIVEEIKKHEDNAILKSMIGGKKFVVKIGKEVFDLRDRHFIVERNVPEGYGAADFRDGIVYLDCVLDSELEAEGFSREIMRRVQSLRKKEGLEKKDEVELHIKTDVDLDKDAIAKKCGASSIEIGDVKELGVNSKEKIKNREFVISFKKTG
jgi:isoleucyl-tRNA synthetase